MLKKTGIKKIIPVFIEKLGCYVLCTSEFVSVFISVFVHSGDFCALFIYFEV